MSPLRIARLTPGMSGFLPIAVLAALCLAGPVGAVAPTLQESHCASGTLVDPAFRDAALRTLAPLAVRAPGLPADGAVRAHDTPSHVDPQGQAWYQVSAYQVNFGLLGALRVSPSLLPMAADWLRWQARHISDEGPARGVVLDHWQRVPDFHETTCPPGVAKRLCNTVDSYDSTAASTLLLADAYLRHGGDLAVLREPGMRRALEAAATALHSLSTSDGLTIAKPSHPVIYTMDMAEVVAGWRAWARLQELAYAQPASAVNTRATADQAEATMGTRLWHTTAAAWRVSLGAGAPQPASRWYADTMAQAWPLLWGTATRSVPQLRQAWVKSVAPWERAPRHWAHVPADADGFWWPAAAVAAHCVGDTDSARAWVARARGQWMDPAKPFAWPFQVGDLLWLLWLAPPQAPVAAVPPAATLATAEPVSSPAPGGRP